MTCVRTALRTGFALAVVGGVLVCLSIAYVLREREG